MTASLKPQNVDSDTWYYEEKRGILVVHQTRDANGKWVKTDQFLIRWPMLRASLARQRRPALTKAER